MRLRSVFVSDVHLGSKGCRADLLLEFLKSVEVENLYLVGDIFDLWAMRKGFFWPQEHNNVVRTILGKAKGGTRVIYIPGNHDEELREFCGSVFGNLEIRRLREDARQKLGARFDIKLFHDVVLEDGSLPLWVLREKIERWVAEELKQKK